jgi:hypothetical protein
VCIHRRQERWVHHYSFFYNCFLKPPLGLVGSLPSPSILSVFSDMTGFLRCNSPRLPSPSTSTPRLRGGTLAYQRRLTNQSQASLSREQFPHPVSSAPCMGGFPHGRPQGNFACPVEIPSGPPRSKGPQEGCNVPVRGIISTYPGD